LLLHPRGRPHMHQGRSRGGEMHGLVAWPIGLLRKGDKLRAYHPDYTALAGTSAWVWWLTLSSATVSFPKSYCLTMR
jgi:hypothetical protein